MRQSSSRRFVILFVSSVVACKAKSTVGTEQPAPAAPSVVSSPGPIQVPPALREATSFQEGFAPIVDKLSPAVVNISSVRVVRSPGGPFALDPFFHELFGD